MPRALLLVPLLSTVALAAPVPKEKGKVDPGEPWAFPDLKSKGWTELKDGLKVWDVKDGDGEPVKAGATVTVRYTAWLADGKKFDGGEDKTSVPLPLNAVIKGWQEGVPGMKPGGIRRLVVPPELAYGKRGAGDDIPPDATLVFVIELIDAK